MMLLRPRKTVSGKSPLMPVSRNRFQILLFGLAIAATTPPLAQTTVSSQPAVALEAVTSSNPLRDGIELQAGSATVRITALRDDIVRVRIAPGTLPENASWAVLAEPRSKSIDVKPIQDDTS